ncbi:hypothetical protein COW36_07240 [bacterium (Candidatus Blackallbacteria) CG17_big_fil_post_rev_8_21_14_2_50_48_46]|uniref:Uncharacterized protein n=1 Tax=bacterium (Candidatus Blackallbacteria) CG17_big_fil_post_rev_8_21_14_2_50_48_46 TaxID=2014261 RepID=A0A2M7G725_9BACT|nr:MAG: hypothetical protein COW64_06750 [bacterium (Candidatus Blackallbacteria) CG18_big_fil_WC_8_21_14_2_50_49_26]PIW17856.1 MAG: hypothetical protein COW36_07240 [bacterium (Candidatus Blackallbacteria) CG17_big_fil_post_rev_8_21_14_2_50_48_46]PIW48532.1 MAG: hypothetical protein COW20_09195 [bacterium (Candidatus Blackallbacteria) CG13_big_fil_rev_8_21_14_2_50_49_14]
MVQGFPAPYDPVLNPPSVPLTAPPTRSAPGLPSPPLILELDLQKFTLDQHQGQRLDIAPIDANQVDFDRLSTRILTEVAKVEKLKPETTLLIRVGQEAIEIPALRLDKAQLIQALKRHFQGLQSPGHQEWARDLQAQAAEIRVQLRENPPAPAEHVLGEAAQAALQKPSAEGFALRSLEKEIGQKIPVALREKYGLNTEALKHWRETGTPPAGLKALLADFNPQQQQLFQPLLYAVAFGKAVNAVRLKAGSLSPDAAKVANQELDTMKSQASQKWEQFNAGAVRDTRKLAERAFSDWKAADQTVQALQGKANPSAADLQALAEARQKADKLKQEAQSVQQKALETAHAMKEVRVHRVEVSGGNQAPEGMREKAAHALLDAAGAEASHVKQEVGFQGGVVSADALPEGLGTAQTLVEQADTLLPEWKGKQALIDQRTQVLQAQREVLKPLLDTLTSQKQTADQVARLRTELAGLPQPAASLPEHLARRKALESQLDELESQQTPALREDPLGSPTTPAEVRALTLYGRNLGQLQTGYAAEIALNQYAGASPAQKEKVAQAARASRDLHLEAAQAGQDSLDASQASASNRQESRHWQQFGRQDVQARIDAAEAEIAKYAEAKTPGQFQKLLDAQKALGTAMQEMREGDAKVRSSGASPSGNFANLRAQALAEGLGIAQPEALAQQEESAAVSNHVILGRVSEPAVWLAENGSFLASRGQLNQQALDRAQAQLGLEGRIHADAERRYGDQKTELKDLQARLKELPAGPERTRLLERQTELKAAVETFEGGPLALPGGSEWLNLARADALYTGPQAAIRGIQAAQAENVDAARDLLKDAPSDTVRNQAIDALLAAAGTLPQHTPKASADCLKYAFEAAQTLQPEARKLSEAKIRQEAVALYKSYVQHPHASAAAESGELARVVDSIATSATAGEPSRLAWEALRQQSNPAELFRLHKAELEQALGELQDRVSEDIEAGFNLAVERGGLAVGSAARIARALMRDGDIAGARQVLAEAVGREMERAKQAEADYLSLPAAKQEHYRAILRSSDSPGEKQAALEKLMGNSVAASRALRVADSSQTMQRAHLPGSDYDLGRSARQTAEKFNQYSSGVQAQGGAEAENIAKRSAWRHQRDEAYWNDPKIAVLSAATDEALMFVATMGLSTALSLAKGSATGLSLARRGLEIGRATRTALEGNRAGRVVLSVGNFAARGNQRFGAVLARMDAAAMQASPVLGYGFRASRSLVRNIAMEELPKAASELAKQYGDSEGWLQWAVDTSSRFAVSNLGDIKGLESLANSSWGVFETAVTQMALPEFYKHDPKGLKDAQELTHYLLMGAQTVHGMAAMHHDAKRSGQVEGSGLAADLASRAKLDLDPAVEKQVVAAVSAYQEHLLNNQGLSAEKHHTQLEAQVKQAVAFEQLPPEARREVERSLQEFIRPYQIQTAAQIAGVESLHPEGSTAAEVKGKIREMADILQKQGVTADPHEAQKIARGQVAAQMVGKESLSLEAGPAALQVLAEAQAQRLLDLGAVDSPAHAMLLVQHQVRQAVADKAALLLVDSPEAKAQLEKLDQGLKALDALSAPFVYSAQALPANLGEQRQAIQKIAMEVLMSAPEGSQYTQLQARIEKYLGEQKWSPSMIHQLSREVGTRLLLAWGEHLLQQKQIKGELAGLSPTALHDTHLEILKGLGLPEEHAGQVAHDRLLSAMENAWAGQVEQAAGIKPLLHEVLSELGRHQPVDQAVRSQVAEKAEKGLLALGVEPAQARELAAQMVLDGQAYHDRFQGLESLPRTRSLNASLEESLHLSAVKVGEHSLPDLDALRGFLQTHTPAQPTPADDAAVLQLYTALGGWDQVRKLSSFLKPELFGKLHEARDRQVEAAWKNIEAEAAKMGLELARPYVGRGPGEPGYTGVYADIDLVVRITKSKNPLSEPEMAHREMQLLSFAQAELAAISPASGHALDVNVYTSAHFLAVDQAQGKPAEHVPPEALAQQAHQGRVMELYQLRQGLGPAHEMAWKGFEKQALEQARKQDEKARGAGQPAHAEQDLRLALSDCQTQWSQYHDAVDQAYQVLRKDPAHAGQAHEILLEQAQNQVRQATEHELTEFLLKNREALEQDTPAGALARVEYDRLQQLARSRAPEAYAGNAAVLWGSRINDSERQGVIDGFASDPRAARSGRISHDQYVLHWAVEMEGVKDLSSRAWKAGKYDLRDILFTEAALSGFSEQPNPAHAEWLKQKESNLTGGLLLGPEPPKTLKVKNQVALVEKLPNPEYLLHQERKQKDPDYLIPKEIPKEIPISRMEAAIDEARRSAQTPLQAEKIWVKHFGSPEAAEKAMNAYLEVVRMTILDSASRQVSSPALQP